MSLGLAMRPSLEQQFFPYFQPIIDVGRKSIVGYEALGRTRSSAGTISSIGPLFSDASVDRQYLLDIDRCIRRQAMARFADVSDDVFLSLNLLPEWMSDLPEDAQVPTIAMAQECGLAPERILIEFIEAVGETPKMQELVGRYRDAGMRIAIDDFGAGHSHIDRLITLEPDFIKMDMSFFKRGMAGGLSQEVVKSLGELARRSGCHLLCEGVETKEEFFFALDCNARFVQGYFFYPPSAELITPDYPQAMLTALLAEYVQRKIGHLQARESYHAGMSAFFSEIESALRAPAVDLVNLPVPPEGFLRAYLCHRSGDQLSPNYESFHRDGGGWACMPENRGMNWSMRPYFHQILAAGEIQHRRHSISSPYRDLRTGQLCQTLGTLLDDGCILLADVAFREDRDSSGDDLYLR